MIRDYESGDAKPLTDVWRDSILGLGTRAYGPAALTAWAERVRTPEVYHAEAATRRIWVWDDGTPAAFIELEPDGHIDRLYALPRVAGRGVGARLIETAMAAARDAGLARLFTEASELARGPFARAGFTVTGRRDFEIGGVPIHNYAMEMTL